MVKTDTCASCGQTFPLAQMRYVKIDKEYIYLCTECRRKHKAQVKTSET